MCCAIVNLYAFSLFYFTSWNLCGHCSNVRYHGEYPFISYVQILKLAVSAYIILPVFNITLNNSQATL